MHDNDVDWWIGQTNATPALAVSECLGAFPWAAILTVVGSLILTGIACALFL